MQAGPYIKGQIERAKAGAAHYRREAAILRTRAEHYEEEAIRSDDEAHRWAAGTDEIAVGALDRPRARSIYELGTPKAAEAGRTHHTIGPTREKTMTEVGWEVEGFIDRLTKRNDTNSERLVLEAIRYLRAFSRDCDALRESNSELRDEIGRLRQMTELASGGVVSANAEMPLFGALTTRRER
jgi:hypothetical protein